MELKIRCKNKQKLPIQKSNKTGVNQLLPATVLIKTWGKDNKW